MANPSSSSSDLPNTTNNNNPTTCWSCGSHDLQTDSFSMNLICLGCGITVQENRLVSEINFTSDGGGQGRKNAIGHTVNWSVGCSGAGTSGLKGSRDVTMSRGKGKIESFGTKLRINVAMQDQALRIYGLAVDRGFNRGRKSLLLAAACLYIVCRSSRSPLLLIDFADHCEYSIRDIGQTYIRLVSELKWNELLSDIPVLDPSLYMERFAYRLNHLIPQDKIQLVSQTAVRIVQQMKRDWIHEGRRPTGLCGAALLVAARFHGIDNNRITPLEVAQVVRMAEGTLQKRLIEMRESSMAGMRKEEILMKDYEKRPRELEMGEESLNLPPVVIGRMKKEERMRIENDIGEASQSQQLMLENHNENQNVNVNDSSEPDPKRRKKDLDHEQSNHGNHEQSDHGTPRVFEDSVDNIKDLEQKIINQVDKREILEKVEKENKDHIDKETNTIPFGKDIFENGMIIDSNNSNVIDLDNTDANGIGPSNSSSSSSSSTSQYQLVPLNQDSNQAADGNKFNEDLFGNQKIIETDGTNQNLNQDLNQLANPDQFYERGEGPEESLSDVEIDEHALLNEDESNGKKAVWNEIHKNDLEDIYYKTMGRKKRREERREMIKNNTEESMGNFQVDGYVNGKKTLRKAYGKRQEGLPGVGGAGLSADMVASNFGPTNNNKDTSLSSKYNADDFMNLFK